MWSWLLVAFLASAYVTGTEDSCDSELDSLVFKDIENILQSEIEASTHLIELQQKKVIELEKLREKLSETIHDLSTNQLTEIKRALQGRGKTDDVQNEPFNLFDNNFVKTYATTSSSIVATSMMSVQLPPQLTRKITGKRPDSTTALLLCELYSNGTLSLIDVWDGSIIGKIEFVDSVTNIFCWSIGRKASVIAISTSGDVYRSNVTLVHYGLRITGDPPADEEQTYREGVWHMNHDTGIRFSVGFSPSFSNFVAMSNGRKIVVLVSDKSGQLSSFFDTGDHGGIIGIEGEPILKTASNGRLLAYATSAKISFASVLSLVPSKISCFVPNGNSVMSIAFDAVMPYIIYAGTNKGEILIYNTKSRSSKTGGGATECALVAKLAIKNLAVQLGKVLSDQSADVSVATIRGYLISSMNGIVVVYNTSTGGLKTPHYQFSTRLSETRASDVYTFNTQRPKDEKYQLVFKGGEELVVFYSLLKYADIVQDMSWIRGPLIFMTLAVVFVYQFMKQRRGNPNTFNPQMVGADADKELKKLMSQAGMSAGFPRASGRSSQSIRSDLK